MCESEDESGVEVWREVAGVSRGGGVGVMGGGPYKHEIYPFPIPYLTVTVI